MMADASDCKVTINDVQRGVNVLGLGTLSLFLDDLGGEAHTAIV